MSLAFYNYLDETNMTTLSLAEGVASEQKVIESSSVDEVFSLMLTKKNYIQQINDSIEKSSK